MEKKTIFEIKGLYRDDFRVTGYTFGTGEKAACIMGNFRGNEFQQIYTCSLLVDRLKKMEEEGRIKEGKEIFVIPSGNPYSINVAKRFWATDNTDINRMFPGYNLGETTQRVADGIFQVIKEYKIGMQMASFYMPGTFMPHVRMMETGFEDVEMAKQFGLPYIVIRKVRPYDTTTLNYNWQIWETKAFSIYTTTTEQLDKESAKQAVKSILNFMGKQGLVDYKVHDGYLSQTIADTELLTVRVKKAGFFDCRVNVGQEVMKGELLAEVVHPYEGVVIEQIFAPEDGIVFFSHDNQPLTYANTAVFKIVRSA